MKRQIIHDPIEDLDFHLFLDTESEKLSRLILSGGYHPEKPQRILVEKSKGLCRQIVVPSARDAIVLQCLSDALYYELIAKSPTRFAFFERQDYNFSARASGYGTFASWKRFQRAVLKFSREHKFIIVTDIANYYDSISYIHLRNTLSSLSTSDECVIDMLIHVLSDLLWQPDYSPRIEVGLPQIDLDAPRLLAHCFLYELDGFIASNPDVSFARFMDDIDIGADTIIEAKNIIKSIDLVLQTKQIRINSGKTQIFSQKDALSHFRFRQNLILDSIKSNLDRKIKTGKSIHSHRSLIEKRIDRGMKSKIFDTGNGEKILKRWINIAITADANISQKNIMKILKLRPNLRSTIFKYVRHRPMNAPTIRTLNAIANSGYFIDDFSTIELGNCLVESFYEDEKCKKYIKEIINSINEKDPCGFYSKIWLQTRFSSPADIVKTLTDAHSIWSTHDRLGRLVGAIYPLFLNQPEEVDYNRIIVKGLNAHSRQTYGFQRKLIKSPAHAKIILPIIKATNASVVTGITHSKFLCAISILQSENVPIKTREIIIKNHAKAFSDVYYRKIALRQKII